MPFFESLLQTYGVNEPIVSSEITFKEYSRPWICKQLTQLCREGKLVRYEKGIYYIPVETFFGKSILDPRKVIEKKYIARGRDVMGYYSGLTIRQQLRLTTQVPNVIELYTNNETSRVRDVMVGKQKVLLRSARTTITSENAAALCFLELMNDLECSSIDEEGKSILGAYIDRNGISRKDITMYAPFFPDRAMRNLIESEVIYLVAR